MATDQYGLAYQSILEFSQAGFNPDGLIPIYNTETNTMHTMTQSALVNTGSVSTDNSSTTILSSGGTFTGEWEDVSAYSSIVVAVKTDQNGTFSVQFSPDGVNQDSTLTRYYSTGQIEAPHRFTVTRQYMRIVFENTSASAQTYFRLQTLKGSKEDLNAPLDSVLARDFDSTSVRPSDYHSEVALGLRQDASTWNKFGYNEDVDTGSDEIIASWGGTYQFLTVGETIDIVSTSTADDDGGTGVNSIVVYGVDENWDAATEVVTMDGTTTVTTTSSWIGINRVAVFLSGSGQTNAGTINITATTSGYTMAQMPTGGGVSQQCIYFVPQKHQFLAEWVNFDALKIVGGGGNFPELTFLGQVYSAVNNTIQEVYRGHLDTVNSNNLTVNTPIPFPVTEKSILFFTATTDISNTSVTCRFSGELHKDVDA